MEKKKGKPRIKVSGVEISRKDKCSLISLLHTLTHTHTCTSTTYYTLLLIHICVFLQPGVRNVLDMGLERPNNFSSRVTLVSESITFHSFLVYCLFPFTVYSTKNVVTCLPSILFLLFFLTSSWLGLFQSKWPSKLCYTSVK